MNAKKVKAIRKACRAAGADPTDVQYTDIRNRRGWLAQRVLTVGCGRAVYQAMKEHAK